MTTGCRAFGWSRRRGGNRGRAALGLSLLLALKTATAHAAPVSVAGVAGFDHYDGLGQTTNGAIAALVLGAKGGDLTLAGARYDNSRIGAGYSLTTGVGVPLAGTALLRVGGTRVIGDQTFRAWRANIGPQFGLPGGRTVTLSYAYYSDNLATRSKGLTAEATSPLAERLSGKMSASYARVPQNPAAVQGSIGLGFTVSRGLELSAEVGAVRDVVGAFGPSSSGGGSSGGLPLLGGGPFAGGGSNPGGGSTTVSGVERTLLIGVRKTFP